MPCVHDRDILREARISEGFTGPGPVMGYCNPSKSFNTQMIEIGGQNVMNKGKRVLALGLATALLTGLTACGNPSSTGDSTGQSAQGQPQDSNSTQEFLDSITPETAEAKGVCGADLTWYYQDNVLVIKGTGEMTEYDYNEAPWEDYQEQIGKLIIEEGCTSISEKAFLSCETLSSVVLPDTMVTIGEDAFLGCHELQSVDLGNGLQIIGENAFYASSGGYDNKISTITIPASVTSIGRDAFDGIPSITFLGDAPEMDITDMICSWNVTIYYSGSGFEPYIENWVDEDGDYSITWIKQ